MAGVCDQLALPYPGRVERRQHHVERAGQAGDLVVALDGQPGEVLGAGDPLDGRGEPADRPQAVAGDQPAGEAGGQHAESAERDRHPAQPGEDPVLVVQRLCDDECEAVLLGLYGDDPVALVIDEESADARFSFALRDVELGLAEADVRAPVENPPMALGEEERDANVSRAQRPGLDAGLGRVDQCVGAGRKMRPLHQRVVEALLHLESGGAVGGHGDEGDHQAHGHDRQQDHPAGERPAVVPPTVRTRSDREGRPGPEPAHVSFSTYPTPRTVWISRVSSPDSVLRRR